MAGQRRRARFLSRNTDVPALVTGVGPRAEAVAALDELTALLDTALISIAPVVVCKVEGRTVAEPPGSWRSHKLTVHTNEDSRHGADPCNRDLMARLRASDHAGGATTRCAGSGVSRGGQRPHGDRILQIGRRRFPVTDHSAQYRRTTAAAYACLIDEVTARARAWSPASRGRVDRGARRPSARHAGTRLISGQHQHATHGQRNHLDHFQPDIGQVRPRPRPVLAGQDAIGATRQRRAHQQHLHGQHDDGEHEDPHRRARRTATVLRGEPTREHHNGEDCFAGIERPEHQTSDTEPDRQRDTWRPEFQRRFQERDREHHAEPDERRGDREPPNQRAHRRA